MRVTAAAGSVRRKQAPRADVADRMRVVARLDLGDRGQQLGGDAVLGARLDEQIAVRDAVEGRVALQRGRPFRA